ncbi:MAG: hypothetical protein LBJ32_04025 [Oscillospiraceae bacterium]|jgi:transcriptional regulator with XRE-family HTH domain|nr:hypothetical protein [Oscillospiraceae bacterium]
MGNKKREINEKFGTELKIARMRLNLPVTRLAELLDITPQQVYNLEKSDKIHNVIKYLFTLRANNADLNSLFDNVFEKRKYTV